MTKAEKFARLNGIEWFKDKVKKEKCKCGDVTFLTNPADQNPTFSDAKSIIEVMIKREDFIPFIARIGRCNHGKICIDINYILNPDKLLDEAVKWCEVHNQIFPESTHEPRTIDGHVVYVRRENQNDRRTT